ncbi:MAG: ParB/RepB/Spo0J family partition protein [Acidobacteria bacterium]|nr:MAG: ParB/RepB/Spo0J family partition protein [Acidobacteriota bacterium]
MSFFAERCFAMVKGRMSPPDFAGLTAVDFEHIDFSDQTFAIAPDWFPVDALIVAIRRVGLLCPPHLQCVGPARYRVIRGFRRLRAASSLGVKRFNCLVRSGDPVELFVEALFENASSRPLHLLEKANAVWRLTQVFRIAQPKVIGEFLPVLGVKPNRFEMNRLLDLAQLSRPLQEAIVHESLQAEIALSAARWDTEEQSAFLQVIQALRPGFSRQKELFTLLDELRGRERNSVVQLLSAEAPENLETLLHRLRSCRFPKFSEYEKLYEQKKAGLRLPPEIQFHVPPFFEGEKIQVGFAIRTPAELRAFAARLQEIADKPELAEIFELL